ncbi:hypothetical protein BKI52_40725 [marine bacterium AO1-C]|nr:hypothetical protein BKI52_40725 [marine bacterium AO1-C]
MTFIKKVIRFIFRAVLGLVIAIALYLLAAVLGTWVTTGKLSTQTTVKDSVNIYIVSNGMHTDFVLPLHHLVKDWRQHFNRSRFGAYYQHRFISFGWGDQAFFLNSTKEGFPKLGTTLKAVLWPTKSLMHVSFYRSINTQADNVYKLNISAKQYQALVKFIFDSFVTKQAQKFRYVAKGYGDYDFFFEAHRSYHLFFTCNNWTNRGLGAMNIRSGIWTPLEQGIIYHIK